MGIILLTNLFDKLDDAVVSRVSDSYIWSFDPPTPAIATDIACNYIRKELKRLNLQSTIALNSRTTRKLIYEAMEVLEGMIVGRSIEALVEEAAISAITHNREMSLENFLRILKKQKS